jgi:succinate dehydrogenase/fumarate reductase flavoprotein subunit
VKASRAVPVQLEAARDTIELMSGTGPKDQPNSAAMLARLQAVMSDDVGPLRTREGLVRALAAIEEMTRDIGTRPFGDGGRFDLMRLDWFDLRNMLLVAHTVAKAALARTESRGAHQREDYPGMLPEWRLNQIARLSGKTVALTSMPASPVEVAAQ